MHFKETFTLNMDYVKILHIRGSLIKLHQNIPFYDLFPFMCFKQCFMKDFIIFYCFEVWYISPLNTWKQQDLTFACIHVGKMSIFKWRKNRGRSPFSTISFYMSGLIILAKGMIWYNVQLSKNIFLKNSCNLGHSVVHSCNL